MQIIIPMSGFGERFRRAGYQVPKPLIEIDGKPIIAHVVDLFPGETDILFICNEEHLAQPDFKMRETLQRICPTGRILAISPHKLGPVHAVLQIQDHVNLAQPTIVNYCDFTCYWEWAGFKNFVNLTQCDGCIPAYKGFHPHSLGTTNYAYMREKNGWMLDIQEKKPFTEQRMNEFASSGTYYFSSGKLMLEAFAETVRQDLRTGGEFYVSLAYLPLLQKRKKIAVYELQHFMQWGTPEDVQEYQYWSNVFRALTQPRPPTNETFGNIVVPMAGLGARFAERGYQKIKPLIEVSGLPMAVQAVKMLPKANENVFVLRQDLPGLSEVVTELKSQFEQVKIEVLPGVTEGQACTAMAGIDKLQNADIPVTIGACDSGALYCEKKLREYKADVLVWGIRSHPHAQRNPKMYGWIKETEGQIRSVSVKTPLENPATDPIVLGTFTFRNAEIFRRCVERMLQRNGRVNNEFYIDTCINDAIELGYVCKLFEVDAHVSWGTPDDLLTFEYWQSCFHKWAGHPYRLENDSLVAPRAIESLLKKYQKKHPTTPEPWRNSLENERVPL